LLQAYRRPLSRQFTGAAFEMEQTIALNAFITFMFNHLMVPLCFSDACTTRRGYCNDDKCS